MSHKSDLEKVLEPNTVEAWWPNTDLSATISAAISLKRIADALENVLSDRTDDVGKRHSPAIIEAIYKAGINQ